MTSTPDFIIIGAMKCATSTLHEQLSRQAGIFMTALKEPNFFSDEAQWSRGMDWYASLFAAAPSGSLRGESSTHYTKLPTYPLALQRMQQCLPDHVRFIYIMRHPVDRLISHYIHDWTEGFVASPIDEAIDRQAGLIDYGRYAMQLQAVFERFSADRVLPVFFERLCHQPQSELERICRFIGYAAVPKWHDDAAEVNASRQRMRRSALRAAARALPGARRLWRTALPTSIRERVNDLWRMKSRPSPSPTTMRRIIDIFDSDLAVLGRWLNLELNCMNFKSIAAAVEPAWHSMEAVHA